MSVTTGAWMMLQRNLLYTAVTRAKKLVVLVGSRKAIGQAVRTVSDGRRPAGGAGAAPGRSVWRTSAPHDSTCPPTAGGSRRFSQRHCCVIPQERASGPA